MHCLTGLACQGGVEVHWVSAQATATEWLLIIDIQLEWWHAAVLRRQPSRFVMKINANQPSLHCMGCCRCRICMRATAGTLDLYPIPTVNLPDHEKTYREHLGQPESSIPTGKLITLSFQWLASLRLNILLRKRFEALKQSLHDSNSQLSTTQSFRNDQNKFESMGQSAANRTNTRP